MSTAERSQSRTTPRSGSEIRWEQRVPASCMPSSEGHLESSVHEPPLLLVPTYLSLCSFGQIIPNRCSVRERISPSAFPIVVLDRTSFPGSDIA